MIAHLNAFCAALLLLGPGCHRLSPTAEAGPTATPRALRPTFTPALSQTPTAPSADARSTGIPTASMSPAHALTPGSTATPHPVTVTEPDAVYPRARIRYWRTFANTNEISRLLAVGEDTLWVAARGGMTRWNLETREARVYGSEHGLPGTILHDVALAHDGTVWCGTDVGLAWFDSQEDRWRPVSLPPAAGPREAVALAEGVAAADLFVDGDSLCADTLWVGGAGGVWRCTPSLASSSEEVTCEPLEGLCDQDGGHCMVRSLLLVTETGDALDGQLQGLWIGTDKGVLRYLNGELQRYAGDEGAPSTFVQQMAVDGAGSLWMATLDGVYRYRPADGDGETWTRYGEEDGLVSRWVNCLLPMPSDENAGRSVIWFGTQAGISRYDPNAAAEGQWTTLTRANEQDPLAECVSTTQIVHVSASASRAGGLWFATDGGLWRLVDGQWFHYGVTEDGLPSDRVTWMTYVAGRGLFCGTDRGLALYDGAGWARLMAPARAPSNDIARLYAGPDGSVWMSTAGAEASRIARLEGDAFKQVHFSGVSELRGVSAFRHVSDGTLWLSAADRVLQVDPSRDLVLYQSNCLPLEGRDPLLVQGDGTIWLSSDAGLVYRWADAWTRIDLGTERAPTGALCMLEDDRGTLWIGTADQGMFAWNADEGWRNYSAGEGGAPDRVLSMAMGADGHLWLGTLGRGVRRLDPATGQWTAYMVDDGVPSDTALALLIDEAGLVLVGTPMGAARWDGSRWTTERDLEGLEVRSLAQVRTGSGERQLWAGTDAGLWMRAADGWLPCPWLTVQAEVGGVSAILQGDDATIWLATDGGLVRRSSEGQFHLYREAEGFPLLAARSLALTPDGVLWMGTPMGIVRLDTTAIEGGSNPWTTPTNCGPAGVYHGQAYEDGAGQIWFSSMDGLSRYAEGRWVHERGEALPEGRVHALAEDALGRLWAVGWQGAAWLGEDGWSPVTFPADGQGLLIQSVIADGGALLGPVQLWFSVSMAMDEGTMWRASIWRWDGSTWHTYDRGVHADSPKVPTLVMQGGPNARLWAITEDSVAFYDVVADGWVGVPEPQEGREGMPSDHVAASDGSLWMGTWGHGAYRLRYDKGDRIAEWTHYTAMDGLASNGVHALREDGSGAIWFVTDAGLSRFGERPSP